MTSILRQYRRQQSWASPLYVNYMKDIRISDVKNTDTVLESVTTEINKILQSKDEIEKVVSNQIQNRMEKEKGDWIHCWSDCYFITRKLIKREFASTAYVLKLLSKSIVNAHGVDNKLTFVLEKNATLTGKWKNDQKYFTMMPLENRKKTKLIMGFGPSASGKTFWAKNIITLISKIDAAYPTTFLAIDGGIAREVSFVYQTIVEAIMEERLRCEKAGGKDCTTGFANLVNAGVPSAKVLRYNLRHTKSLLAGIYENQGDRSAITPKKAIQKFLAKQTQIPSLYVPDTASGTDPNKFKKYIDLTGDDKWLGLYIWQHKFGSKCTFAPEFQCKGCIESGSQREGKEGKKYSSSMYERSQQNGLKFMKCAPGGRIDIHNGGGRMYNGIPTISTVTEHFLDRATRYLFTPEKIEMYVNNINSDIDRINIMNGMNIPNISLRYIQKEEEDWMQLSGVHSKLRVLYSIYKDRSENDLKDLFENDRDNFLSFLKFYLKNHKTMERELKKKYGRRQVQQISNSEILRRVRAVVKKWSGTSYGCKKVPIFTEKKRSGLKL